MKSARPKAAPWGGPLPAASRQVRATFILSCKGGVPPVDPLKGKDMAQLELPEVIHLPGPMDAPPSTEADQPTARKARRGTEKRKRTTCVTSRYDAAEFAELTEAASRAGLTPASYQRVQSLAQPKTRSTRRAPIDREMLGKALGQLGKVGSNLNQLARAANLDRTYRAEIMDAVTECRALLPHLMKALGREP